MSGALLFKAVDLYDYKEAQSRLEFFLLTAWLHFCQIIGVLKSRSSNLQKKVGKQIMRLAIIFEQSKETEFVHKLYFSQAWFVFVRFGLCPIWGTRQVVGFFSSKIWDWYQICQSSILRVFVGHDLRVSALKFHCHKMQFLSAEKYAFKLRKFSVKCQEICT